MSRAAIRYAKAIFDLASDNGQGEVVLGDMKDIQATIAGSKDLRLFLGSPIIKAQDKREGLKKVFGSASATTQSLIDILIDNKREGILEGISEAYVDLYNHNMGVQAVKVTTAVAITDAIKTTVLAKVKAMTGSTDITIENEIDERIIGGFILRVGDMQYNASIANQLNTLKREFTTSL